MEKVKILMTCPNCGNSTWVKIGSDADDYECLSCGDVSETVEMCPVEIVE